jgi:hypothetical protein
MSKNGLALLVVIVAFVLLYAMMQPPHQAHASHPAATMKMNTSWSQEKGGLTSETPTLSADFIDQVLATAHSPAAGTGDIFYQQSLQFHIDDVYALAFFHHESDYGKAGVVWNANTHSIGNIRCTAGYACDPSGGYRSYPTWEAGIADWYQLIANVYIAHGLATVAAIIPVYAPAADHNDEGAYIHNVLQDVAAYRHGEMPV